MKQNMIILAGNIGTGKSLIANKYAKKGFITISMDAIQSIVAGGEYDRYDAEKRSLYHATETFMIECALQMGHNIIIDRTNMTPDIRKRYIDIGKSFGDIKITGIDFGPGDVASSERRCRNPRNIPSEIWLNVHRSMKSKYIPMSKEEGFDYLIPAPKKFYVWAYDFDGTIVENNFPGIGEIDQITVDNIRFKWKDLSNIIIIWSCRHDEAENIMRSFLIKKNIPFDFINENPLFETGSRKIFAHAYIDDRNA